MDSVPYAPGTDFELEDLAHYFVRAGPDGFHLGTDDIDEDLEVVTYTQVTNYDQDLTSAHKYLGDSLRETSGRTIFEEGVVHQIPIIFLKSNLIPGQIFPLIARTAAVKELVKYVMARNRVFGVSYKLNENMRSFGTIAEIYAHSGDIETSGTIHIKAMGHQRYEIIKTEPFPGSNEEYIALAQIKIVPDSTLPKPYNKLCLHPRSRHLNHENNLCRKKDMWQTQWPDWVYKQFDVDELALRVAKKVKMLYNRVKISDDPYLLSLQVTRLGIFNPEQVSYLLGIESTNLRLQQELNYWNENQSMQKFMCKSENCNTCICDMRNVFPMSPDGPQGTYCNSWGQIHEMITVTDLDVNLNIILVGHPSDECCWFPGYKWTIILCPNCQSHLGWRYTADDNSTLTPREFYGLTMRSITSDKEYIPYDDDSMDFMDYVLSS